MDLSVRDFHKGGAAWSPWPDNYWPAIDPMSMRRGVDRVRILFAHGFPPAPLEWRSRGTWIGHHAGMAIIQPDDLQGPWLVDPVHLDEEEYLWCPTLDTLEFEEGWFMGRHESLKDRPISTKALGVKPGSFGRGLAKGYIDIDEGRRFRAGSPIPYNEEARRLARFYPDEYPIAIPRFLLS